MVSSTWVMGRVMASLVLVGLSGCAAEPVDSLTNAENVAESGEELGGAHGPVSPGRDLAEWNEIYTRWSFGLLDLPTDKNGHALVGKVVLMPVPQTAGDGTAGSLDVKLAPGQAFFLPLWGLLGTSYSDGTSPDPFEPVSIFKTLDIRLSADGKALVTTKNVMRYYAQFDFEPAIPLDFPPIDAVIWMQGVGILSDPLCVGSHTIKLDVKNTEPAFGSIFEFHNTWHVSVRGK